MDWQPIETAPVGMPVLVTQPITFANDTPARVVIIAEKSSDDAAWFTYNDPYGEELSPSPLRWQPLPEPFQG